MTLRDCLLLAWWWFEAFALCVGRCALWVLKAFVFLPILFGFFCEQVSMRLAARGKTVPDSGRGRP